jgi:hypothetical protein
MPIESNAFPFRPPVQELRLIYKSYTDLQLFLENLTYTNSSNS